MHIPEKQSSAIIVHQAKRTARSTRTTHTRVSKMGFWVCGSGGVFESCTFYLHDGRANRGCPHRVCGCSLATSPHAHANSFARKRKMCEPQSFLRIYTYTRHTHKLSVFFFLHVAIRNSLRSNNIWLSFSQADLSPRSAQELFFPGF